MKNGSGVEAGRFATTWSGHPPSEAINSPQASMLKRAMDIVLAVPLLVFILPLLLVIALLVKLWDGGPVLFVQRRCGLNGKTFSCYKFRTMRVDAKERLERLLASDPAAAEEWARFQKLQKDPRVTPIGRFLRKASLDELPQLLNILRGEMSVVGPRPITSDEIYRYGADFAYYSAVRPGVVGLWQVSGRSRLTYEKRVALDVEYVRTWTLMSDVRILARSIPVVLFGAGAC